MNLDSPALRQPASGALLTGRVSDATAAFGPYKLRGWVGAGATCSVYRATLGEQPVVVALKILTAEATRDDRWRRRFQREALILRGLLHRNIVACLDFGELEGHVFLAMELVEGHSGRSLANGLLKERALARLGAQIADGLAEAHGRGLIHRDLKPENIVVTPDGVAKILDFGLARPVDPAGHDLPAHLASVTGSGVVIGTTRYMSPEQSRGEPLTVKTDVFGLGLCLFELAAGRHPFESPFAQEVLAGIRERPAPPLERWRPDLPAELRAAIDLLLGKEPSARPAAREAGARFLSLVP